MSIHITTEDTFFTDAITINDCYCSICTNKTTQDLGWIGARCRTCKQIYNLEDTMPDIVRRRREAMKLNRLEMSKLTGYKRSTIKRYEYVECSRPYYDLTGKIFNKFLKQK